MRKRKKKHSLMHYSCREPFYFVLFSEVQKVKALVGLFFASCASPRLTFCDSGGRKVTVGLLSTYWLSFHSPL